MIPAIFKRRKKKEISQEIVSLDERMELQQVTEETQIHNNHFLVNVLNNRPLEVKSTIDTNKFAFYDIGLSLVLYSIADSCSDFFKSKYGYYDNSKHIRERLEERLKAIPSKKEEIKERQDFFRELWDNSEFYNSILDAHSYIYKACQTLNSITGDWLSERNIPRQKFEAYIDFLGFVLSMDKARKITSKSTQLFPIEDIGNLIDDKSKLIAGDLVEQFEPTFSPETETSYFNLTYNHKVDEIVYNRERWVEEWRKRFDAATVFAEVLETPTNKFNELFDQRALSLYFKHLRKGRDIRVLSTNPENLSLVEENTNCTKLIYNHLNERIEGKFPILKEIGGYFQNKEPRDLWKFYQDLEFYVGITHYMKQLEQKGFSVSFPEMLPKEKRTLEVMDGCELYVASKKDPNSTEDSAVLNDVLHDPETSCFFITGPNGCAKTTFSRQVGQIQVMSQHGAPIISRPGAKVSYVDGIYTIFHKSDTPEENLGTYQTQLRTFDRLLSKTTPYCLVLLDEVDMGTEYNEAKEATRIVLETLAERGTPTYVTSHMHEIAEEVETGQYPHCINMAAEIFHKGDGSYTLTHKILRGKKERSYGHLIREEEGFVREKYRNITETMKQV